MKHSVLVKFFVILLTACSLTATLAGAVGIAVLEANSLYELDPQQRLEQEYDSIGYMIGLQYIRRYAAEHLGGCSQALLDELYSYACLKDENVSWHISVYDGDTPLVRYDGSTDGMTVRNYSFAPSYPIPVIEGIEYDGVYTETLPAVDPTDPEESRPEPQRTEDRYVWEDDQLINYILNYYQGPEYDVTVYMQPEVLEGISVELLMAIYPYRYGFIVTATVGLLLFAAGLVFLAWSAGRTKTGEIRPGGLNRMPLDLYLAATAILTCLLVMVVGELCRWVSGNGLSVVSIWLIALTVFAAALPPIGLLCAVSAQVKARNGFWWRRSIIGFCLQKLAAGLRFLLRGLGALMRMLPVIWQWLLTAVIMALGVLIAFCLLVSNFRLFLLPFLAVIGLCMAMTCYGGYAFGLLISGAKKMSRGDLNHKIPTKYLYGIFRDFAGELNTLSEAAKLAAQQQMRSERMKTELITNVSHDIKTPLTSIINFVDLLQKPHTAEENEQYLEVLSRQSNQMKRLIEDLMDLSKASTGNMSTHIVTLDAVETVNQALGEFADKLEAAGLTPLFRQPSEPVRILADGRLTWRVLSNLLSNAVKYAMPGTRLYIDLARTDGQVLLSIKNISREPLTLSADELMERFVRGDAARTAEGSGLGLNIAQSLMEVQHGQLRLLLDGDLFKVMLSFPAE